MAALLLFVFFSSFGLFDRLTLTSFTCLFLIKENWDFPIKIKLRTNKKKLI